MDTLTENYTCSFVFINWVEFLWKVSLDFKQKQTLFLCPLLKNKVPISNNFFVFSSFIFNSKDSIIICGSMMFCQKYHRLCYSNYNGRIKIPWLKIPMTYIPNCFHANVFFTPISRIFRINQLQNIINSTKSAKCHFLKTFPCQQHENG